MTGPRRIASVLAGAAVLVTAVAIALVSLSGAEAQDDLVDRVAGEDRWSTAGELARHVDGDTLWVATGFDFADALAAGATGAGPVLLVAGDSAPAATLEAASAVDVERVRAVGGSAAIGDAAIEAVAEAAGVADVERVAGSQRFETAAAISQATHPAGASVAYVATGLDFADALTASAAAADDDAPVLLAAPDTLPQATRDELARLDVDEVVVVGGEAAVGPEVETELGEVADDVDRVAGDGRFATATAVSQHRGLSPEQAFLATGEDFPDVLAAAPAAITVDAALLLSGQGVLPEATRDEITRLDVQRATIAGGPSAVSEAVADQVRHLLDEEPDPPPPDDDADEHGSRENPYPMGTTVAVGDNWELSVRASDPDATERVLEHNEFNDPPADGHQFFIATVRLTYTGEGYARSDASFRLRAVGDEGVTYTTFDDGCGAIPDEIDDRTVFAGGTIEGNVCWQVPNNDTDSLVAFDHDHEPREYFSLTGSPADDDPFPTPAEPTGTATGSRGNPHPPGDAVTLDDGWELEILGSDRNATDRVLDHNQFNEPPPNGHQFFIAEVEATYTGDDEPARFDGTYRLGAVGSAAAIGYRTFTDSCGSIPDELDNPETYQGGTITGNICWQIRSEDAESLLLYDTDSDPYPFLATP